MFKAGKRRSKRPKMGEALNSPPTANGAGGPGGDPEMGITLMAAPLLVAHASPPLSLCLLPTLVS